MLGRERLIVGTKWMLENVRQKDIFMNRYFKKCGTPGCWMGWMSACPQLKEDGFNFSLSGYLRGFIPIWEVNGKAIYPSELEGELSKHFNLSKIQYKHLFSQYQSGDKHDILKRLHEVLQQPGPNPEPEIENLDEEWKALQALVQESEEVEV